MLVAKLENMEASTDFIAFYDIYNHNGRLVRRFAEVFCIFWVRFGVIWYHRRFELQKMSLFGQKWCFLDQKLTKRAKLSIIKCKNNAISSDFQALMVPVDRYGVVIDR